MKVLGVTSSTNLNSDKELPTEEQIYCWWVHFQWGLGAPEEYFKGLEDGFKESIIWMIKHGYLQMTDEGKKYIPDFKIIEEP